MTDNGIFLTILRQESRRHPQLQAVDLQKLVYQAVFGGNHILDHRERFRVGLLAEWDTITEELEVGKAIQLIDPDGRVARVHLGPCRRIGMDPERLADRLLAQPRMHGTTEAYEALWARAVATAETGLTPVGADALRAVGIVDSPPHHSATYGPTSYRLIHDLDTPGTRRWLAEEGLTS